MALSRADLRGMTAEQIAQATNEGRLDHLLTGRAPTLDNTGADQGARGKHYPNMRGRLRDMTPAEISRALDNGQLDGILRGGDH